MFAIHQKRAFAERHVRLFCRDPFSLSACLLSLVRDGSQRVWRVKVSPSPPDGKIFSLRTPLPTPFQPPNRVLQRKGTHTAKTIVQNADTYYEYCFSTVRVPNSLVEAPLLQLLAEDPLCCHRLQLLGALLVAGGSPPLSLSGGSQSVSTIR